MIGRGESGRIKNFIGIFLDSSYAIFILKLCGAACSFLVSILFLNFSNSAMLGKFALALTTIGCFAVLVTFGQNVLMMRFLVKEDRDRGRQYVRDAMVLSLMSYAVISPFVFLILYAIFPQGVIFFFLLFTYYAVAQLKAPVMLCAGRYLGNSLFDDFLRMFWGAFYTIISLLVAFVVGDKISAFLTASILISPLLCYAIWRMVTIFDTDLVFIKNGFNSSVYTALRRLTIEGAPVVAVAFLGLLLSQFDRVYVSVILGYSVAGVYYAAQTLVTIINYFNQALISRKITAMVGAYQREEIGSLEQLSKRNAWVSFLFTLIAIAGYVALYPLIKIVFNVAGAEFFWVSMVLLCMQSVSLLFGFGSTMMLYSGAKGQKTLVKYLLVSFFVGAVLGGGLVYSMGMVGAAIGTGVGIVLNRVLPYIYFKKRGYCLGVFGRRAHEAGD